MQCNAKSLRFPSHLLHALYCRCEHHFNCEPRLIFAMLCDWLLAMVLWGSELCVLLSTVGYLCKNFIFCDHDGAAWVPVTIWCVSCVGGHLHFIWTFRFCKLKLSSEGNILGQREWMVENDFMFEAGNLIGFNNMNLIIILNFPPVLFRWWIVVGSINYFGLIFDKLTSLSSNPNLSPKLTKAKSKVGKVRLWIWAVTKTLFTNLFMFSLFLLFLFPWWRL